MSYLHRNPSAALLVADELREEAAVSRFYKAALQSKAIREHHRKNAAEATMLAQGAEVANDLADLAESRSAWLVAVARGEA